MNAVPTNNSPHSLEILVRTGATPATKTDAIRAVADMLAAADCVDAQYVESLLQRETTANTYLDSGVAIPHGMLEDKHRVRRDAIAVLQVPAGVRWNDDQTARLVVGIAAAGDGHLDILRRLTRLIQDKPGMERLCVTTDESLIRAALQGTPATATPASAPTSAQDFSETLEWTLDYPAGLHARPASRWVEAAKTAPLPLRVRHANGMADPRELVALLQLGVKAGDTLTLSAQGQNAVAVLQQFRDVISGLSVEEKAGAARAAACAVVPVCGWKAPGNAPALTGVAASPGLAIGVVRLIDSTDDTVPDRPAPLAQAGAQLDEAISTTRLQMKALVDDATRRLGAGDAAIFSAQAALLDDSQLLTRACKHMVNGHGAAWSWHASVEEAALQLAALDNPILAGRAVDLRDVGRRVLVRLMPELAEKTLDEESGPLVIVARDLTPSRTAGLDPAKVVALATSLGGPTSHTAILARTLGIAAVVAAGNNLLAAKDGDTVIVDGDSGRVWLNPDPALLDSAQLWLKTQNRRRELETARRGLPATTTDGTTIEIAANVNNPEQVPVALELGAEGVGLMRTEFLFLESGETPSEDQQYEIYSRMVQAMNGRPLIVRTLDIGGDKQVAHLRLPHEDNPFLGVRGSRLLLRRNDLFEPQMQALYRVAKDGGSLSVMFSMITTVSEVLELRRRCEVIRQSLNAPQIPLGIMIEVPAAAVVADKLAKHVDFFSIGTNDLTQYALAMDRQNPELAPEADSLHPAVLRLIRQTVTGAALHGRWVGVCGGIAGDPLGAALLAGLGVNELSMTPRDIPGVKDVLRRHSRSHMAKLAEEALQQENAADVRQLATHLVSSEEGDAPCAC